jgi:hypothetical protein
MPATGGRATIETLIAAGLGAIAFNLIGLPAATLSGAMVGGCLLLVAGRRVELPASLRETGMLLGGVIMGAAVTPEMIAGIARYPLSLLLMTLSVLTSMLVCQAYLVRFTGMDRATALFASTPGALSSVLAVAADTRADMNRIVVIQSLRLFVLVAILPSLVTWWGVSGGSPARPPQADPVGIVAMVAVGAALSLAVQRAGLAAAWIFGGMIGSAALHGSGLIVGDLPQPLVHLSFLLVGAFVATRFSAVRDGQLRRCFGEAVAALIVVLAVSACFAQAAAWLTGKTFAEAMVAFAPGGLEAMLILGAALALDPVYVGLHHLLRFFGIGLLIPFVARLFAARQPDGVPERDRSSTDVND